MASSNYDSQYLRELSENIRLLFACDPAYAEKLEHAITLVAKDYAARCIAPLEERIAELESQLSLAVSSMVDFGMLPDDVKALTEPDNATPEQRTGT